MTTKSRWSLVNYGMVNWYLINARDIPIAEDGIVLLTGPNGAGKSSLLDGLSAVLQGAPRDIAFNAVVQRSRAQNRRTLRDYALGTIDDARLRDSAISCLLLGWRHNKTGQELTSCIYIEADIENSDPVVRRFIVGGRILEAEDIIIRGADDPDSITPLSYEAVISKLRHEKLEYQAYEGATLFSQQLCSMLSPKGGTIRHRKFLKNLRHMMAYKDVNNPTVFVRDYVLDKLDVDFTNLRRSIQTYREIQLKVTQARENLAKVKSMEGMLSAISSRRRRLARTRMEWKHYELHFAHRDLQDAHSRKVAAAQELVAATVEETSAGHVLERARQSYQDVSTVLNSGETAAQRTMANARLSDARHELGLVEDPLLALDRQAQDIRLIAVFAGGLDLPLSLPVLAPGEHSTGELALALRSVDEAELKAIEKEVGDRAGQASALVQQAKEDLRHARANQMRGEEGRAPLSPEPEQLLDLLKANGIDAEPLCQVVTTVDEDWRNALEVLLGPDREALLVSPSQVPQAMELVRWKEMGGRVIDTTKSGQKAAPIRNSLASKIQTSDPHARAYLDFRLGSTYCAESVEEARSHSNAVTRDLFHYAGRIGRSRRRDLRSHSPMLGFNALIDMSALERVVTDAARQLVTAEEAQRQAQQALLTVAQALRALGALKKADIPAMVARREEAARAVSEAARLKAEADAGLADAEKQLAAERQALTAAETRQRTALTKVGNCQGVLETLEALLQELSTKEEQKRLALDLMFQRERPWLAEDSICLLESFIAGAPVPAPLATQIPIDVEPDDPRFRTTVDSKAGLLVTNEERRVTSELRMVLEELHKYGQQWGVGIPGAEDDDAHLAVLQTWTAKQREFLESHELVRRQAEADQAYKVAQEHLGNDYLGRMSGAIEDQERQLRELNRNLRDRRFHDMKYQFITQPLPEYEPLLNLLKKAPTLGADLPLFLAGQAGSENPYAFVLAKLQKGIFEPEAEFGELADPRQWFTFDIEMKHQDGTRTTFTKRQGTGSGGQVQAPFYVALCCALASTSFVTPGGQEGGIAVAILDEAFQRMDSNAIAETVRLFDESGLQLMVAAPDKEQPTFMQFSGTMLSFYRSGTALSLTHTRMGQEGRDIFKAENPSMLGFEKFKAKMQSQTASFDDEGPRSLREAAS